MKIKEVVKLTGIGVQTLLAIIIAQETVRMFNEHYRITITSVSDSIHSRGSLHYIGNAVDIRIKDMKINIEQYIEALKKALGKNYDVVKEIDHIHIEYQPKLS